MKDYSALKREIQTYIRTNNNQEITGDVLQNVLVSIVSNVGENAGFGGIAKKTTSPGTPDGPVFYFATEQGVYPNFGGLEIERENTLNIIYNTEDGWDTLFLGNLVPNEEVEDFRTFKHLENMNFEQASEYCATFDNIIEKIGGGAIRFSKPVIFTFSYGGTDQGMIINSPSSNRVITQYAFTKGNVNSGFSHRLIQYDPTSLTITNIGEWMPISSLIPAATTSAAGLMSAGDKASLDAAKSDIESLQTGKADTSALNEAKTNLVALENAIQNIDGDTLYVTDADGNVIAKINNQGIESVEVAIAGGKKLSDIPNDILEEFYKKQLYISDANGNSILHIDENGHLHYLDDDIVVLNDWRDKVISTYGDSVVAVSNGDFTYPYSFDSVGDSWNWGNRVAQYYKMSKHYGRGVGGQGYKWTTSKGNGGAVTFVNATSGAYAGRDNAYNYDNYTGDIPEGCVKVRGCLASWGRITAMYPASIKDSIDVVLVMAHNDAYDDTECSFIQDDSTDQEWAVSGENYYGKINGDYDLTTLRGGIASTLMKLQLWMPNAIIVLMSGISGHGTAGEINVNINSDDLMNIAQAVREMSNLTSVPCIDTFSTDGINGWNRTTYIADSIHPYTVAGSKMFARAVIGGLKTIIPNF